MKVIISLLFGTFLMTYAVGGTIMDQSAFSLASTQDLSVNSATIKRITESIGQSSTEGSSTFAEPGASEVISGQPIETIPNSFIVLLKSPEVSALQDFVASLNSQIEAAGGNISAIYDQFGMFNIKFDLVDTGAAELTLPPEATQFLEALQANPAVEAVFNDGIVSIQGQVLPNDQNRVDADLSATRSGDGNGTVDADIAILDTGVQIDHPDLNVFKCVSFVNNTTPNVPLNSCADGNGHGTHVAGTAAALDNNFGIVGKAPGARIWAIKVMDDNGTGAFSDILEGLNFVATNSKDIDVVNMSLGGQGTDVPTETAVTNLVNNNGVVVVISAGNDNLDAGNFTPARTPAAITVSAITDSDGKCGGSGSATPISDNPAPPNNRSRPHQPVTVSNPDDFVASYSNFGSVVDIAAPGTRVNSTVPLSLNPTGFGLKSGTSMAAPNVAGAVALIKSLNPTATPAQVETFLKNNATQAPPSGNPLVPCDGNGRGYFNDIYPAEDNVTTDAIKEPLLFMAQAPTTPPVPPVPPVPPLPPTPVTACDPKSATLRIGASGDKVFELQQHLTRLGFGDLLGPPGIDGKFGPRTQSAVKAFQQNNGLQVDGIVGPITWGKICELVSGSAPPRQPSQAPGQAPQGTTPPPEIVFVLVCSDGRLEDPSGVCADGSQPQAVSTDQLVCSDGAAPNTNVTCADGSQPVFRNASAVAQTTATPLPAIVFVLVCGDGTLADPSGVCADGSQPQAVSTDQLVCSDGAAPNTNVTCADGSQPVFTNASAAVAPITPPPTSQMICADGNVPDPTSGLCADGSQPQPQSLNTTASSSAIIDQQLACSDGSSPDPSTGLCADGTQPQSFNTTAPTLPPSTTEQMLCADGSIPDPNTGGCADGSQPQ